ncbi:MAG: IclR family transcriptional regulator [Ruminococcaceae bacterium]|nr:IclR family transcriptional regulator [Oscillospiraceae bacterium]
MSNEAPVKNLDKVLDLLTYLSQQDEPQNVAQLSRYLNVTRNTIYAMLASLQSRNFVEKSSDGRFSIGYGLLQLVSNYNHQYPFLYTAQRHMQDLSVQMGLPVSLFVYKPGLNCLRLSSTEPTAALSPGGLVHACTTAPGKLLLAAQPDEVIWEELKTNPIEKYTEKTITKPEQILAQIPTYRSAEYAVEFGERFSNSGTVAASIRDRADHVVAAISVFLGAMPSEERLQNYVGQLRLTAARISAELGNFRTILI